MTAADWLGRLGNRATQAAALGIHGNAEDDEMMVIQSGVEAEAQVAGVGPLEGLHGYLRGLFEEVVAVEEGWIA